MHDLTDRDLGELIRVTLRTEAQAAGVGSGVPASRQQAALHKWRQRRAGRRHLALLGLAAAVVLPASLALAFAMPGGDPPVRGTVAILMRDVSAQAGDGVALVAVAADGRERLLAMFPTAMLPSDSSFMTGVAAESGRLALGFGRPGEEGFMIADLARPDAEPVMVRHPMLGIGAHSYAWGPDGRFATWVNGGTILIVDPASGGSLLLRPSADLPTSGLQWTANGSGIAGESADDVIVQVPTPADPMAAGDSSGATGLYQRPWPRDVNDAGARLLMCRSWEGVDCGIFPDGSVVVRSVDGGRIPAYQDQLAPDRVVGASFADDGESVWLLTDRRRDGRTIAVAHAGPSGDVRIAAEVNAVAAMREPQLHGIAPDDSLVAVGAPRDDSMLTILLTTDGTGGTYHEGMLVGWAAGDRVSGWPGGPWTQVPGTEPPPEGALPTLPSVEDMVNPAADGEIALTLQGQGTPAGDGQEVTTSGSAILAEGVGLAAACIGPSTMTIEFDLTSEPGIPTLDPVVVDCLAGRMHSQGWGDVVDGPLRVSVRADDQTTWRLVVTDPPPRPERPGA